MNDRPCIVIHIGRGTIVATGLSLVLAVALIAFPGELRAQKAQESFKEKLNITTEAGGVGIATSADGKHVYVVGPAGVLVSDSYGQTGTWTQTVRMK